MYITKKLMPQFSLFFKDCFYIIVLCRNNTSYVLGDNWNTSNIIIILFFILGTDLLNKKSAKQEFHQEYFLFSCWTILFSRIWREKQNLTPLLLVEIKLLIKKTNIFLMKFLFHCFENLPPGDRIGIVSVMYCNTTRLISKY